MKLEEQYLAQLENLTDVNQKIELQQKLVTVKWLKEKIAPINGGRAEKIPNARKNCVLVAEECLRVLSGTKEPELVPAKKMNLDITLGIESKTNKIVYHEVHRQQQIEMLAMAEFNELIEILDEKNKVEIDLQQKPRTGVKYITTKHSDITAELKSLAGSSSSNGSDKTLVGLIYYHYKNKKAGHLANFFRDSHGHVFFVDAQLEKISDETPKKIFNYVLTEEVFYFVIPPKNGFYVKKEIDLTPIKTETTNSENQISKKRFATDETNINKRVRIDNNTHNLNEELSTALIKQLVNMDLKTLEVRLTELPHVLFCKAEYFDVRVINAPIKKQEKGLLQVILEDKKSEDYADRVLLVFQHIETLFNKLNSEQALKLLNLLNHSCFKLINDAAKKHKNLRDLPERFMAFYAIADKNGACAIKFLKDAISNEGTLNFFFNFNKKNNFIIFLPAEGRYDLLNLLVNQYDPMIRLGWERTLDLILKQYTKSIQIIPNNLLITAINKNLPVKHIEKLIDAENINYSDDAGASPLALAITNHANLVKLLLEKNADPTKPIKFQNQTYRSALEFAEAINATDSIINLIKKQLRDKKNTTFPFISQLGEMTASSNQNDEEQSVINAKIM